MLLGPDKALTVLHTVTNYSPIDKCQPRMLLGPDEALKVLHTVTNYSPIDKCHSPECCWALTKHLQAFTLLQTIPPLISVTAQNVAGP